MITDEKGNIDFGEWVCPKSWDDIKLSTYQEIERFYEDKNKEFSVPEVLHILCNKTVDEVNALPISFLEKIMEQLAFLQTAPDTLKPTNEIEIDGEKYMVNVFNELKTGEYIATDTVLKADKHDYASLLAILCRKENEAYDSEFEAKLFEKRREMYLRQPVTKILPIVSFFLSCYSVYMAPSLLYSMAEEQANLIQKNLENLEGVGRLKKCYMKWRVKTLLKRLKSNRPT